MKIAIAAATFAWVIVMIAIVLDHIPADQAESGYQTTPPTTSYTDCWPDPPTTTREPTK